MDYPRDATRYSAAFPSVSNAKTQFQGETFLMCLRRSTDSHAEALTHMQIYECAYRFNQDTRNLLSIHSGHGLRWTPIGRGCYCMPQDCLSLTFADMHATLFSITSLSHLNPAVSCTHTSTWCCNMNTATTQRSPAARHSVLD